MVDIYSDYTISLRTRKMNAKFMQTLEKDVYMELKTLSKERGVTVQEFLRAVVVPDWMSTFNGRDRKHNSR